jgi:hypothetical protein
LAKNNQVKIESVMKSLFTSCLELRARWLAIVAALEFHFLASD